ncbi:uncharacterized protein [Diabrotica undecimpunctata]|uniref:uncharacterized protein n=1 Tax=Diabrotica undecimpunctata TaxID=50387 RepID=UPI003B636CC7
MGYASKRILIIGMVSHLGTLGKETIVKLFERVVEESLKIKSKVLLIVYLGVLPTIEFKKYDGSIKGWLAFWVQFKKIHEDESIDCHDKIEYLIQATVPGSRARQLVESYPAMADNYSKIMESMQSRFGREDLQIEVYIRELLKLILSKSVSKQKIDIRVSKLYDSIETQLRALETLGITSDKCSAMLFPLIESCLPQELLRVWQRSTNIDCRGGTLENRLKLLMTFLRNEVENEQRIALAAEGFGLS